MNKLTLISAITIFICTTSFLAVSQNFVELDTTHTKYRFPKFIYPENSKVEEKINTALHIDWLLVLPDKNDNPFEVIINKTSIDDKYEYTSWNNISKHPTIIAVSVNGIKNDKNAFTFYKFFDKRTGDSFELNDLFSDKANRFLRKLNASIEKDVPIHLSKDSIFINPETKSSVRYSIEELKPFLNEYGTNLLFESDHVLRRKSLSGKFMKGLGKGFGGKPLHYMLYISDVDAKGNAQVFDWNTKYRDLTFYYESTIKNGVLQADDYLYDSLSKEKVHSMMSLHLEKQSDGSWTGELQTGSPFYEITFTDY